MDLTAAVSNQNLDPIQTLHDQLDTALSRIDDLENRSRRYNFQIRGLPETITDVSAATQDLIKSLLPNTQQQELELDRAHRALGPPRKNGSPRDIIVKPHYYAIKEGFMKQTRTMPQVT